VKRCFKVVSHSKINSFGVADLPKNNFRGGQLPKKKGGVTELLISMFQGGQTTPPTVLDPKIILE
jgi:hypothetical protein